MLMLRALLIGAFFFVMTPLLISIQWLLEKLHLPGWGFICSNYYRVLRAILRIRVRIVGEPVRGRAMLFVSNHASWVDIVVIGSVQPVAFVAKSEVRKWPLIGITAKMQRTVFVDRARRHQAAAAIAEIVQRLSSGTSVVLFAEGTSSDGNRVLPFRSALLGAIKRVADGGGDAAKMLIQPMSVCYTGQHGIPMGRQNRPLVAWYGDLDFMPHIKAFIERGAVDAVVSYGEPVPVSGAADRKAMTKTLEGAVRRITAATLLGRPQAARAAERGERTLEERRELQPFPRPSRGLVR
jgi:1-acyl-sn-glycerol-3-phosphate acyltransferase